VATTVRAAASTTTAPDVLGYYLFLGAMVVALVAFVIWFVSGMGKSSRKR
jgi:hypothetical protein